MSIDEYSCLFFWKEKKERKEKKDMSKILGE
jgi:hypothetical protein